MKKIDDEIQLLLKEHNGISERFWKRTAVWIICMLFLNRESFCWSGMILTLRESFFR